MVIEVILGFRLAYLVRNQHTYQPVLVELLITVDQSGVVQSRSFVP